MKQALFSDLDLICMLQEEKKITLFVAAVGEEKKDGRGRTGNKKNSWVEAMVAGPIRLHLV